MRICEGCNNFKGGEEFLTIGLGLDRVKFFCSLDFCYKKRQKIQVLCFALPCQSRVWWRAVQTILPTTVPSQSEEITRPEAVFRGEITRLRSRFQQTRVSAATCSCWAVIGPKYQPSLHSAPEISE